ncbi:hypothetical protein IHE49_05595 [Rhodanobacter sp. 7MK24]|uniref:hypothetical protein n=1 Tax=Rhodanobacter sp. 7MK24 TaxID=2775922 RepID=UPI00178360AC|nr:hypothetical protein [Rhodanobacter sp. 7MK24]MBD8879947.1 hypothetical protein [Rhodanobacter sp. 7MK24]
MKRAVRSRLLMLIGATALVALALWQWQSDARKAPGKLLTLDPAAITQATLQLGDGAPARYTKRDGHWWRGDGQRADDRYLETLTEAAAAPVLEWRAAGEFDASRIGLSPPKAVLTLDGQRLAFGAVSATGPQCYVRVDGRVALVSLRFMPQAPQQKQQDLGLH